MAWMKCRANPPKGRYVLVICLCVILSVAVGFWIGAEVRYRARAQLITQRTQELDSFLTEVALSYCKGDHTAIEALLAPGAALEHSEAYDLLQLQYMAHTNLTLDLSRPDTPLGVYVIQYQLLSDVPDALSSQIPAQDRREISSAISREDVLFLTVSIVRDTETNCYRFIPAGFHLHHFDD